MKSKLFLLLCLLVPMILVGQIEQNVTYKRNLVLNEVVSSEYQYIYKEFQNGQIQYKDKQISKAKLNYNTLLDEVHFINEQGKIMTVANPQDIALITIGKVFLIPGPNLGYYEIIENGNISLLFKWKCKVIEKAKTGAYGLANSTHKIEQLDKVISLNMTYDNYELEKSQIANISVVITPYLKKGSKIIPANKLKGFFKAFGHKTEIQQFINQNPIDFSREENLVRLTKFCNTLN